MMTLIEAIEHCKDMAKCEYGECAEEHRQLAEWLMELHDIKTHGKRTETHGVRSEKQVTGKLKNGEDSLVREDNGEDSLVRKDGKDAKEQKSKLDGGLISRQAVLDFIASMNMHDQIDDEDYKYAECYIESLPSADRPTGEWVLADVQKKEDTDNGNYRYICSNCNYSDIHRKTQELPFCWHCGCEMNGGLNVNE